MKPKDEYILMFILKSENKAEENIYLGDVKIDRALKQLKRYQKEYPLYDIKLFKTVYKEVKIEK